MSWNRHLLQMWHAMYLGVTCEPQHKRVEYGCVGQHTCWLHVGHVDFMLLSTFSSRWMPNTNAGSGGIWALAYYDAYMLVTWSGQASCQ